MITVTDDPKQRETLSNDIKKRNNETSNIFKCFLKNFCLFYLGTLTLVWAVFNLSYNKPKKGKDLGWNISVPKTVIMTFLTMLRLQWEDFCKRKLNSHSLAVKCCFFFHFRERKKKKTSHYHVHCNICLVVLKLHQTLSVGRFEKS